MVCHKVLSQLSEGMKMSNVLRLSVRGMVASADCLKEALARLAEEVSEIQVVDLHVELEAVRVRFLDSLDRYDVHEGTGEEGPDSDSVFRSSNTYCYAVWIFRDADENRIKAAIDEVYRCESELSSVAIGLGDENYEWGILYPGIHAALKKRAAALDRLRSIPNVCLESLRS